MSATHPNNVPEQMIPELFAHSATPDSRVADLARGEAHDTVMLCMQQEFSRGRQNNKHTYHWVADLLTGNLSLAVWEPLECARRDGLHYVMNMPVCCGSGRSRSHACMWLGFLQP
jgi:hypothetical protein